MTEPTQDTNKTYIVIVTALTFIIPAIGFIVEYLISDTALIFELFCKWFIFSAVGLCLFLAGIRQATKPEFTDNQILWIGRASSFIKKAGWHK